MSHRFLDASRPFSAALRCTSILLLLVSLLGLPAFATDNAGFSHDEWASVLDRFVDDEGFVDYDGLSKDRSALDRYVAAVGEAGPESRPDLFANDDDRLAYYINAYNALVFAGVLERGPERESVWKGGLISGYRFFVKRKWTVDGREMSLKFLEDELIREGFEDPRIHAALNCASVSCPRLPREPFLGVTLQSQLDAAIREFVGAQRNLQAAGRSVRLSKIFDWFKADFVKFEKEHGGSDLISYVNRYLPPESQLSPDLEVSFFAYDKGINSQRR